MVLTRSARKVAAQAYGQAQYTATPHTALADVTNANDMCLATPNVELKRVHGCGHQPDHDAATPQSTVSRVLVREMAMLGLATPRTAGPNATGQESAYVMPQKLSFGTNERAEGEQPLANMAEQEDAEAENQTDSGSMDGTFQQLASPSVAQNLMHVRQQQTLMERKRAAQDSDDIMSILGAGFTKAAANVSDSAPMVQKNDALDATNPSTPEPQVPIANFCMVGHEISKQWQGQHIVFDLLGLSKVKVVAERVAFDSETCNTQSSSGSESAEPGRMSSTGCTPARIKRAVYTVPAQALAFEDDDEEPERVQESAETLHMQIQAQLPVNWCGTHTVYADEDEAEENDRNGWADPTVTEIQENVEQMRIARKGSSQRHPHPRVKSARRFAWL